jgi:hypothetical protein
VDHASARFFREQLYPLQDAVLARVHTLETGFYLSGGTAASRVYLQHRFSDDLDLFTNDQADFPLWADRIIAALRNHPGGTLSIQLRERRFVRCVLDTGQVALKIEMVDDVPSRIGTPHEDPVLGRVDSAENILANKLTALVDRREPKDLADVWGFCCQMGLSLAAALGGAQGKAVGLFAPDVARPLLEATREDWALVRWIDAPDPARWVAELRALGEGLLLATT